MYVHHPGRALPLLPKPQSQCSPFPSQPDMLNTWHCTHKTDITPLTHDPPQVSRQQLQRHPPTPPPRQCPHRARPRFRPSTQTHRRIRPCQTCRLQTTNVHDKRAGQTSERARQASGPDKRAGQTSERATTKSIYNPENSTLFRSPILIGLFITLELGYLASGI
jgi:hypothetical protein